MLNIQELSMAYKDLDNRIKQYLDLRKYSVTKAYSNAILITGKRNETSIYIRYEQTQYGLIINFSNIMVDPSLQRQGFFTKLVRSVSSSPYIVAIKIGSVLTPEMMNWCKKNNFYTNDNSDWYYKLVS